MNDETRALLRQVAQLADDVGPALAPAGRSELLDSITEAALDLFEAAACWIALIEDDELVFHGASGTGEEVVQGMRMPADQGIAGWVVASGQAIAVDELASDSRFADASQESMGFTPRSVLAMPLETDRAMIGVISVLDREPEGRTGQRDMELLGLFARQAALSVEMSSAYNEMGRALFRALANAAQDGDLRTALSRTAEDATGPDSEIAEIAARFHELSLADPDARRAAVGLLTELLEYVRQVPRR